MERRRKMRRFPALILGSKIWTPKQGPGYNLFLRGIPFWGPNSGPQNGSTWGGVFCAAALSKNVFCQQVAGASLAWLAARVSLLLGRHADCCSQLRILTNCDHWRSQQPSPECGCPAGGWLNQSTVGCPTSSAQGHNMPPKTRKEHVRQAFLQQNWLLLRTPELGSGNRHKNRSRCKEPPQFAL